jgi:hypothetical protein
MLLELFKLSEIGFTNLEILAYVENQVDNGARDYDAFEDADSAVHRYENEKPER